MVFGFLNIFLFSMIFLENDLFTTPSLDYNVYDTNDFVVCIHNNRRCTRGSFINLIIIHPFNVHKSMFYLFSK